MAESFIPPERVASAARRGLRLRKKVEAGTDVGVARARDLSNQRPVSLKTIGSMVSFFARFGAQRPDNIGTDADPTPWLVSWLMWGGDAGREWAESVWRRNGDEGEASRMGLARRGASHRLSREAPAPPASMQVHNPDGLRLGRPFRVLTAGETVRDGTTGESLGNFSADVLAEFVRVFDARCSRGEGAPRIDYNHGPSRGLDRTLFGAVVGCYVADDGERGPGLYVVPGWTDYGRDFVAQHATPDGGSLLSNSPEFAVGPAYARSGGEPDELGDLLGGAELLGVALTGSPQQSEAIIDPVRLSRAGLSTADAAEEVSGMDPEQSGAGAGDELAALKAIVAELSAQVGKLAEGQAVLMERQRDADESAIEMAAEGAEKVIEEVTAEAVEEVKAAAEAQMAQLSAEEVAEVEEEMPVEMALSIRRGIGTRAQKVAAWSKRRDLAKSKMSDRKVRALSKKLAEFEARAISAECDAAMTELRAFGLAPADEATLRRYFVAKREKPQQWSAMHGDACPYDREVAALKARKRLSVPMGRAGVSAQPGEAGADLTIDGIKAWAKANGHDFIKNPGGAVSAWEKATGRSHLEVHQ